ncbi:MAG: IS21 family transposase [Lentisphaeria bacterium]|nr:IS21 family transposase [Lentisphaeria bacterium]
MNEERKHLVYEVLRRLRQGESKRGISRALGIARKTIRSILNEEEKRREHGEQALERELPRRRTPKGSKLDVFEEQIQAWLKYYPDLTAVRLHEKLVGEGFEGGYTIVRERLKRIRQESKQAKTTKPVMEVETAIGQQCQFDWSPYELKNGLKVQLWSCVLSFSRGPSFEATDNTRQTTILRMLQHSFEGWGGVPDEAVTDSMPGVVDRWECDRPVLNVRFVDFAAYYDFAVHIAPRGDGAYKGKVERRYRYAEGNLLNGRSFYSLEQFREALVWWEREHAMKRKHPKTKRPIWEMLEQERPHLKPLPSHPYDARDVVIAVVDRMGYVVFETNRYQVDADHIGKRVYLCVGPERLEVFDQGVHRLVEHERLPTGAGKKQLCEGKKAPRGRYDLALLSARLEEWGDVPEAFAQRLRTQHRYPGPHLARILELQLTWSLDDIVHAMEHASRYQAYDSHSLTRILQARATPRRLDEQIANRTRQHIREVMQEHPVAQRSLDSYQSLRTGDTPQSSPQGAIRHDEQPLPSEPQVPD